MCLLRPFSGEQAKAKPGVEIKTRLLVFQSVLRSGIRYSVHIHSLKKREENGAGAEDSRDIIFVPQVHH